MGDSISFEDQLLSNGIAKCPECDNGYMKPEFPNHKRIFDYKCDVCGYSIHFEPAVFVE